MNKDQHLYKTTEAGTVLDVLNDTGIHQDINYACVTAPQMTYVEIAIDGEPFDGVFVGPGSSHSWWTQAGGKILDHNGLDPDQRLTITADGPVALRIDWI
jgi:hypothetical protein